MLAACQSTTDGFSPSSKSSLTVKGAIEALKSEYDGVHHAALEKQYFYDAICKMTTEAQVRAYYDAQGFNMSSDGTGATAIAALKGEPFVGRMPSKAAAWYRGCRGDHH